MSLISRDTTSKMFFSRVISTDNNTKMYKGQNTTDSPNPVTVFPEKPWTPEKISGKFIVSQPIRCEMKPQNWLITTRHETKSSLLLPRRIFNWLFSNTEFLSPFQLFCHQRIAMNDTLQKSAVNQEDRIRHS